MALAQALEAFAHLAGIQGDSVRRRACSVPPRYSGNTAASLFPRLRREYDARIASLRATLPSDAFETAWRMVVTYTSRPPSPMLLRRMRFKPILYGNPALEYG